MSRLPTATSTPSLFGGTREFRPFFCNAETPKNIDGWLYSDRPQLAIHLVQFEDATLLSVTFMHTMMDAMGLSSFIKAWTDVMRGEEDKVLPFAGFKDDPLGPLTAQGPPVPLFLADKLLKGFGLFIFVLRFLFDLLWYWKESERVLCIPGKYIDQMREEALAGLAEEVAESKKPFLSEGDIIVAWGTRAVLRSIGTAANRTVAILNVFSCRDILTTVGRLPSTGVALISNAVSASFTLLSAKEVLEKPLYVTASHVRQSLDRQRTVEQLQAMVEVQKKEMERTGRPAVFGDSSSQMVVWTNWTKAGLFKVDFSSAVVKQGIDLSERANPLGMPSYVSPYATAKGMPLRNSCPIIGKDHAGNWWIMCVLRDGAWGKMKTQLDSMCSMD